MEPDKELAIKEESPLKLKVFCQQCQKPIATGSGGNISAWLFGNTFCSCHASEAEKRLSGAGAYEKTENDTTTREILPAGHLAQVSPEKLVGKTVGDGYQILEFVGQGASGHVFRVQRRGVDGIFALKILTPSLGFNRRHNQRFLKEVRLARELNHPNIVALYDAGITDDEIPFIVTDFFDGVRLSDSIKDAGPLDEAQAIDLFIQICDGLVHAHYMGVLHLDLKPSNVRIAENDAGEVEAIKVVDCGVSRVFKDATRDTRYFTTTGFEYGEAAYMSPEQCKGAKLDGRSDIYSLGCLMYEVLCGRPPFKAEDTAMLMYKHVHKRPRPLKFHHGDGEFSKSIEDLVMRCLQKEPLNRYQSVSDIREDLETIKAGKAVRRAFPSKLSYKEKNRPSILPEKTIATISAIWFGMSFVGRSITMAFVVILLSTIALMPTFIDFGIKNERSYQEWKSASEAKINSPFSQSQSLDRISLDAQNMIDVCPSNNLVLRMQLERLIVDANALSDYQKKSATEDRASVARLENRFKACFGEIALGQSATISKVSQIRKSNPDNADLTRQFLSRMTIENTKLAGADFGFSDLRAVTFKNCDLTGARFNYANLRHTRFVSTKLTGADFAGTILDGSTFLDCDLRSAAMRDASLKDADFMGGRLEGLKLDGCDLQGAGPFDLDRFNSRSPEFERLSNLRAVQEKQLEALNDKLAAFDPKAQVSETVSKSRLNQQIRTLTKEIENTRRQQRLELLGAARSAPKSDVTRKKTKASEPPPDPEDLRAEPNMGVRSD